MLQILLSLGDEDRHGYGILLEIERRMDGQRLGTGTLYTAIKRLLARGLIEETRTPPVDADDDPRRRYYHLTELGREVARVEAGRLSLVVRMARDQDLLPETRGS
jgi:DNA-binding PadR family transcriptional regulator